MKRVRGEGGDPDGELSTLLHDSVDVGYTTLRYPRTSVRVTVAVTGGRRSSLKGLCMREPLGPVVDLLSSLLWKLATWCAPG